MSKIFVDQKIIDIDDLTTANKQNILKALHGRQDIVCECNKTTQLLVKQSSRGTFYISRKPKEGHLHEIGCRLFFNPPISGVQCYEAGVVKELYDGSVRINLGIKLNQHEKSSLFQEYSVHNITNHASESIRAQPAMSLLGLLHYLWERSGLNSTTTFPSSTKRMYEKLRDEASLIHVSRTILDDMLLTSTVQLQENNIDYADYNVAALQLIHKNNEIFDNCKQNKKSMLLISELSNKTTNDFLRLKYPVEITGLNQIPFVAGLWEKACLRFPLAINTLEANSSDTRVIVIAKLDPYYEELLFHKNKKITKYHVVDIAMMSICVGSRSDFKGVWKIPFDSSYELETVRKLMNEQRCFNKPLRFDAHRDIVFPDFILTDTKNKVPMEVWGMVNNDQYKKRKCEKTAYYEEIFPENWWEWDVDKDRNIPEFPLKVRDCLKPK